MWNEANYGQEEKTPPQQEMPPASADAEEEDEYGGDETFEDSYKSIHEVTKRSL